MNDLNQAWQQASEDLYKAQQPQGSNASENSEGMNNSEDASSKDDSVQDVPYEEVSDDKK